MASKGKPPTPKAAPSQAEIEEILNPPEGEAKSYSQLLQEGHQPQGLLKILASEEMANIPTETPLLEALQVVLNEQRPLTARYYGRANINVLRLLVRQLPRGAVQAMHCGGGRVTESERIDLYHHGVMWWDEGGQPAELDIRDSQMYPGEIQKILDFKPKRPPRVWLLSGKATEAGFPSVYTWRQISGCMVGVHTAPEPEAWKKIEELRHDRIAITRSWLRRNGYSAPGDPPDSAPCDSERDVSAGAVQVTCAAWQQLSPEERERRERGATLMKASHSTVPFYAERAAKWGGDEYWAELFDNFEE